MKFTLALSVLAALAAAAPAPADNVVLDVKTSDAVVDLEASNGGLDLQALDASNAVVDLQASKPAKDQVRNDVTNNVCKPITFIFARGTLEPENMGILVGPPIFEAIERAFPGQVAAQGVKYPASIPGYLAKGDRGGGSLQGKLAMEALRNCPNTKIILSGYSQGGYLVHHAAQTLDAKTTASTMALIFGDPLFKKPVGRIPRSRTLIICHPGDSICGEGIVIKSEHLTYSGDSQQVVAFVKQMMSSWPS